MKKNGFILLCLLLFSSRTSEAHQAIFIDNPINTLEKSYEITNIEESQAIYSQIMKESDIDIYSFEGKAGQKFYTQLMVPDIDESRELLLTLVVLGPFEDANYLDQYTPLIGQRLKGYVIDPGNNRKKFFEPFTQTSYLKKQQFSLELPIDGTYFIAVYSPVEQSGKYVLTVGQEESFGIKDLLHYPATWFKVNYWFNPLRPFSMLVLVGLVLFAVIKLLLRGRRKKRF